MNVFLSTFLCAGAGIVIGIFFYGGLWLTVRALITSRHPVLLSLASFWTRTVIALAGILLAAQGRWQGAVACLAGFALGRGAVSLLLNRRRATCT